MRHHRPLVLGLSLLFAGACGPQAPGSTDGGGGGMDASAEGGTGGTDAGSVEEDAGTPITGEWACSACDTDEDCEPSARCADLGSGERACLPACDIEMSNCPPRFDCVRSLGETSFPDPICAPIGELCCVDSDGDMHGTGVGCLGADCDEADATVNGSSSEICNGSDDDCDGTLDEGEPSALCPRGPHVAESVCTDLGVCENRECEPAYGDCDDDRANGCETQTSTEVHCGGCFVACAPANATGDCSSGTCGIGTCNEGFGDCNGDPSDGCETPLDTVTDCGSCGSACEPAFAVGDCSSGTCQIGSCNTRHADCDASPVNGCETSTTSNTDCGGCGLLCAPTNAVGECSTGTCRIVACTRVDFGDCDGSAGSGCERSLRTTTDCGACGVACSVPGGSASCSTGSCQPTGCATGLADCDSVPGCEQATNTPSHCGDCNTPCSPANATGSCSTGACRVVTCQPGWGNCDGIDANGCETRLDTTSDCGACGTTCSLAHASGTCSTGSCLVDTCDADFGQCDTSDTNGCETSLTTNSDCGGCGVTCSRPSSTTSCSTGACAWTGCEAGRSSCDGSTSNGCEVDHETTVGACGGGEDVGAYDGDRSCGFGCASNTGWDNFATRTDRRDAWFRGTVREGSPCSADIEHRIRLAVPAGVDYDLYVHQSGTCETSTASSLNRGAGLDETVIVREAESTAPGDELEYDVHVVWVSGSSCASYTIYFDGHDC